MKIETRNSDIHGTGVFCIDDILIDEIIETCRLIILDEKDKVLDGSHRLAAYSELYYYYSYDFDFDGKLKIYKRISN